MDLPSDYPGFLQIVQQLSGCASSSAFASGSGFYSCAPLQPAIQQPSSNAIDLNTVQLNTVSIALPIHVHLISSV